MTELKEVVILIKTHQKTLKILGIYTALALLVLLPLLLPGYILTLDLVFTPHLPWPDEVTNTYVLEAVLWALNTVLPGDVVEKLVLFLVLVLSGFGAHQLVSFCKVQPIPVSYWRWGAYFAGIFYMINPFIYGRFMAGQWMVLLGYALLPFFVLALLRLLRNPSWATSWRLAAWMVAISIVSIHHVGMVALVMVIAALVALWEYRKKLKGVRPIFGWLGGALGLTALASSYWLVPALLGKSSTSQAANNFDAAHFAGFATNSGPLGPWGEVVRLQGFWAEGQQLFTLPGDVVPAWGLIGLAIWALVALGVKFGWREQRRSTLILGLSGLVAIILAASPIIMQLSEFIPFIGGYREPQKFINLLALAFAVFAGMAIAMLAYRWRKHTTLRYAPIALLCVPLIFTPTMLWGFAGQLQPRDYPADWYSMNEFLNAEVEDGKILFLPWQQYLSFDFTQRTIANPADKFFEKSIIVSDEMNFRGVPPTVPNEEKRQISEALKDSNDLARNLQKLDIRYILLATDSSDQSFRSLAEADDLKNTRKGEALTLYKIE